MIYFTLLSIFFTLLSIIFAILCSHEGTMKMATILCHDLTDRVHFLI